MSSLIRRIFRAYFPQSVPKFEHTADSKPIKFGILGAANIAPLALITPAKTHPEVVIYAVAARDLKRAEAYAKMYGIHKVYGGSTSYQELLDDPEIEAVYNPLPNGLHFEWTMKALQAGKHVLCEKPIASAEETRQMFDLADKKGLVLLEAVHYRFHPAIQRVKAILDSGELGKIKSIDAKMGFLAGFVKDNDIRFNFDLAGGSTMDLGCYTLNCIRYLSSSNPTSVISATALPLKSANIQETKIDRAMTATLALPDDVVATLDTDLAIPWTLIPPAKSIRIWVEVKCEGGDLTLVNFVLPTFWHSIKVSTKAGSTITTRTEKVYKFADVHLENGPGDSNTLDLGSDWWLTYRYQLEAFVDKLKGRSPQTWITREDSIANMEWVEKIYEKAGIGARPVSQYMAETH
ncbi:hypothetical protein D9757_008091 [Collybiopsis confluens]|uniref:D-xylose 1-dehydrogenase (NADP(+), D-xylono-1,5-lactone-forming) n=1 Tax=Collybiopsis confluens TaxID=2823264 RepID=A0A8H5M1G8_9AGAR|nr:hypothetical protein D9757_008091 [Collybiopsis confluens]